MGITVPRKSEARQRSESALAELRDALAAARITLPSLGLDEADCAESQGILLVDLGRARPDVVEALAEAVRKGASR